MTGRTCSEEEAMYSRHQNSTKTEM